MRDLTQNKSLSMFVDRCTSALESLYAAAMYDNVNTEPNYVCAESMKHIARMAAVLVASENMPENRPAKVPICAAAYALRKTADKPSERLSAIYMESCRAVRNSSGYGVFALGDDNILTDAAFVQGAKSLLRPAPDAPIDSIFFQTIPLSWIGCAYQGMLALRPSKDTAHLESSRTRRKDAGVYFTPPPLVNYIIDSVVNPHPILDIAGSQNQRTVKILDPAMGGGDFLCCAVDRLSAGTNPAQIASECVYGVDIDPAAVEISRFCVWASSHFADGIARQINSHLICADSLNTDGISIDWKSAFAEVFADGGFDAVVGNPPYIAAKNGLAHTSRGQSDSYLLFLNLVMKNNLVRSNGMLSMVLPDPMLVRENAMEVRRSLVKDWTIQSLLHMSGAFRDARVANIVPVCRNAASSDNSFLACRIENKTDRRAFAIRPRQTFKSLARRVRLDSILSQKRYEYLYLLENGRFGEVIKRIHGENAALSNYQVPFVPLKDLNVKAIYRGEEVGKSAIGNDIGDMPVILGGQSIKPYEIIWEGKSTSRSWVKKPIERYHSTKIVLQKSSAKLVAALDRVSKSHIGYVFPQSVYGIELREPGMDEVYLLCILNSRVMNEYIWRSVTGYKFVQPQIELEDIRALPIRRVDFTTSTDERKAGLAKGIKIFESESGRGMSFPRLSNFIAQCIECSDVVHDVLVHIGNIVIDLTEQSRITPSPELTVRLESARAAVETIVSRLYSNEPDQMNLVI
ncbi:N-6 DNA methylase [bacterium]|nr:N-6 DNA methylase [bacterium]